MQHWYTLPGIAVLLSAGQAFAAPRHDVCADLGTEFTWGISSFGAAEGWLQEAHDDYGVDWSEVYIYLSGETDLEARAPFVQLKVDEARSVGALPVMTFYQFQAIANLNAVPGTEQEKLKAILESPALMNQYLAGYVWVLDTLAAIGGPVLVQVEPDSWGFMMWGFGIEGNDDASSVTAMVGSSGFAEVAGMDDDAGSLGRAMVALRDAHAPDVRLGWHASNFRGGQRPEVVTSFFSSMGDWDFLVSEQPHNEDQESTWWEPWNVELTQTNLAWFSALTTDTGLPMLLWQLSMGSTDYHMLEPAGDYTVIEEYAQAGVIGGMFSLRGPDGQDPDTFRETEGMLGTVPPAGHPAGGTPVEARARLSAYFEDPFQLPPNTICRGGALQAGGGSAPDGGAAGGSANDDGGAAPNGAGGSNAGGGDDTGGDTAGGDDSDANGGTGDGGTDARGGTRSEEIGSGDGGQSDGTSESGGGRASGGNAGAGDANGPGANAPGGAAAMRGGCAVAAPGAPAPLRGIWFSALVLAVAIVNRRRTGSFSRPSRSRLGNRIPRCTQGER